MIDWLLKKIIGGHSKRMRMTLLYGIIYLLITIIDKMNAIAFGTFSGVFGVWIVGDTLKKGSD